MKQLGIDASEMDGDIHWPTAASRGITFATIRATWHDHHTDSHYQINMQQARENHISQIGYHWFVPRVDAIAQAAWFAAHSIAGDLPRMVDLEDNPKSGVYAYQGIGTEILKFLAEFNRLTGEYLHIYTSPSYINSYLKGCNALNNFPLVIAHWEASAPNVPLPFLRNRWTAWQFTGAADAKYYGIPQCTVCSLYVWN